MGTKYNIIITERATNELHEIYEYISKSLLEEKIAKNFMKEVETKVKRLEEMPESCNIIEYYKNRKNTYRKLVIKNYVVIYRIDKEYKNVYIVRIVYGGRNYLNEI